MDRFMVRLSLGYPSEETELGIIRGHRFEIPVEKLEPVMTPEDILRIREDVKKIHVDELLEIYAVRLVQATRHRSDLRLGASPRAGMALVAMSQALAYMDQRDFVTPDDIQRALQPVMSHRIFAEDPAPDATKKILEEIRKNVPIPR